MAAAQFWLLRRRARGKRSREKGGGAWESVRGGARACACESGARMHADAVTVCFTIFFWKQTTSTKSDEKNEWRKKVRPAECSANLPSRPTTLVDTCQTRYVGEIGKGIKAKENDERTPHRCDYSNERFVFFFNKKIKEKNIMNLQFANPEEIKSAVKHK